MTKSERRKKAILAQKKRELKGSRKNSNSGTRAAHRNRAQAMMAKHKGGKKSKVKTRKSKK